MPSMCSPLRLLSRMKCSQRSCGLVGEQIQVHILALCNDLVAGEADVMGLECRVWRGERFGLCGQWGHPLGWGQRREERTLWGTQRRNGVVVVTKVLVAAEEEEGSDDFSLGCVKFKQPKRHLNYRDSAPWMSSSSLLWDSFLLALRLTAPLFCHLHPASQKGMEIPNPLCPLFVFASVFSFFYYYFMSQTTHSI